MVNTQYDNIANIYVKAPKYMSEWKKIRAGKRNAMSIKSQMQEDQYVDDPLPKKSSRRESMTERHKDEDLKTLMKDADSRLEQQISSLKSQVEKNSERIFHMEKTIKNMDVPTFGKIETYIK